jgi:hypothetical protein
MLRPMTFAVALVLAFQVATARAHFVWLASKTPAAENQAARIEVYFNELPEPGDLRLIGKVAGTKVWARDSHGVTSEVPLRATDDEDMAALVGSCALPRAGSVEAFCDYGVYERGPGVLLQYYAKHLVGDWAAHGSALSRAQRLTLDVVPTLDGRHVSLRVLYRGQPAPLSEVVLIDKAGVAETHKADSDGSLSVPVSDGPYVVRAAHIEPDRGGERDGKPCQQTWHYCTLRFDMPATLAAASPDPSAGVEAPAIEALARARAARAVWRAFPGFATEITVTSETERLHGTCRVDESGTVSLEIPPSPLKDWVEEQLQTLVQHRMPDGEVAEGKVVYADRDLSHPLGRKIDLGDPVTQSVYRVKDDVITEVSRNSAATRFTISVLEVSRNAENKYLPRSFTMNFFDARAGELKTSLAYFNDWQRLGNFDLPKTILESLARSGGARCRKIEFSNCRLLDSATREAATPGTSAQ